MTTSVHEFVVQSEINGTFELVAELSGITPELLAYVQENRDYLNGIRDQIDADLSLLLAYVNGEAGLDFTTYTAYNKDFGTTEGTVAEGNHIHSEYLATAGGSMSGSLGLSVSEVDVGTLLADATKVVLRREALVDNDLQIFDDYTLFNKEVRGINAFSDAGFVTKSQMEALLSTGGGELTGGTLTGNLIIDRGASPASITINGSEALLELTLDNQVKASVLATDTRAILALDTALGVYDLSIYADRAVFLNPVEGVDSAVGSGFMTKAYIDAADATKEPAFTKGTAFNLNFGTGAGELIHGNDARLSDARTPLAHLHALADLSDVDGTVPAHNQVLTYDGGLGWIPKTGSVGTGGGMPRYSELSANDIAQLVEGDYVRDSTGSVRVLNTAARKGSAIDAAVNPDTEIGHPRENWENLTHPIVATFDDLVLLDETIAAVSRGIKVIDTNQIAIWNAVASAWEYPSMTVARILGNGTILANRHQTLDTTGASTTTTVDTVDYTTHDFTLPDPTINEDVFFSAAAVGPNTARLVGLIDGDTSAIVLTNYRTFNAVSNGTEWISS